MYLTAPHQAQAWTQVHTRLPSRLQPHLRGTVDGQAVAVLARAQRHPGNAAIHDTTVYKVFARWSDDGSLADALIASVGPLSDHHHLDLRVLHGDGTNTVAQKAAMAWALQATHIRRGRKSSRAPTTTAMGWLPCGGAGQ